MKDKLTKGERQSKKAERKQARSDTLAILQSLKGDDIMKMSINKLQKIIKILSDNAGISKNGIIQ
jgi:hypothetical protein